MKLKLDENIDRRLAQLCAEGEDEADTVFDEELSGKSDEAIDEACVEHGKTLITLDLDFSNPLRFPLGPTVGIIVVRPPRPVLRQIRAVLVAALPELKSRVLAGKLWIAEPGRIRVYDPGESR